MEEVDLISRQLSARVFQQPLVFHVIGAIAEFERTLISERTKLGMKAARRRGGHVGRPAVMRPEKLELARRLAGEGKGRAIVARMIEVSPATLRRGLNGPDGVKQGMS